MLKYLTHLAQPGWELKKVVCMLIASWNNMKQIEWFNKKILGVTTDSFF